MRMVVDNKEIEVDLNHYDSWKEAWMANHGITRANGLYTYSVSRCIDREYARHVRTMGKKFYRVVCEDYVNRY